MAWHSHALLALTGSGLHLRQADPLPSMVG